MVSLLSFYFKTPTLISMELLLYIVDTPHRFYVSARYERNFQEGLLCSTFFLFIFTTLNSYFCLSFLGLYGAFSVQLFALSFF